SACIRFGNRTTLGSGKSRAMPPKVLSSASDSLMRGPHPPPGSFVRFGFEILGRVRPVRGCRLKIDARQERQVEFRSGLRFGRGEGVGETAFHLLPEGGAIESQVRRLQRRHV